MLGIRGPRHRPCGGVSALQGSKRGKMGEAGCRLDSRRDRMEDETKVQSWSDWKKETHM